MADVITVVLFAYALVAFAILIRSAVNKNRTAGQWYLAFNIISIVYLVVLVFAYQVLAGNTDTLGTAMIILMTMGAIFVLSVIGVIINLVKMRKYQPGKATTDAVFVVILLVLPILVVGMARIRNDSQFKNADLMLVDKSYTGFVEAGRTNIIVADGTCNRVEGKVATPNGWQWTTQVYWTVEPGGMNFKRENDTLNLVLSGTQKADMQAIFKEEIGGGDPSEYCGAIYPIDGTDYYITSLRKTKESGCFGDNLESHLYKHQQQICDVSSSYNDIYYKK